MLIYISLVSGGLTLVLVLLLLIGNLRNKKTSLQKEIEKRRREAGRASHTSMKSFRRLYGLYEELPIVKGMTRNLWRSLELIGGKDINYLMRKTVWIITGLLIGAGICLAVFWNVTGSLLYTGVMMIFIWYISDSYLDYFISNSHTKLLVQMIDFIRLVRQKYYEYAVVDDAVYEAAQMLGRQSREMMVQGEMIYNLFMESDAEKALEDYMDRAPNPFLKMFVNFSLLTMEYGDTKVEGGSSYLLNLSFLTKNIELEIEKRKKLNYALKSMNLIVILPLLFITPLRNWSVVNFAPLGNFYSSPAGKYVELTTLAIIILSMILLNKIQNPDGLSKTKGEIEQWIRKRNVPISYQHKVKWLTCISGFLLTLIVLLSVQTHGRMSLVDKVYYSDNFMGGNFTPDELLERKGESQEDYSYIKSSGPNTRLSDVQLYLKSLEIDDERRAERIVEKINLYHRYYLKWWQVLLCFGLAFLAYYIPEMNNWLAAKLKGLEIEDEVAGFRSIIMMLMHNPRMNVEEILEWMEGYSVFYKDAIHRCLLEISSGEKEALERMEVHIKNKEMQRLVHQLSMACEDISVKEAFDELVQEKANFYEQRKWNNEKMINRKILLGQNIGFLPAYGLIILYLIVPMIISSTNELGKFFNQLI